MSYTAKHVYDALPSKRDARDYRMMAVDLRNLPETVSLPQVSILDQGNEGACVGHGCAGAREVLEVIANGSMPPMPLSRAFIYYEARLMENSQNADSGAEVRDGCRVLNTIGVCEESLFPYTPGRFADVPPDLDIVAAGKYKIGSYARLNSSDECRAALSNQNPIVIGIAVFESFERNVGADGLIPIPSPQETELGGHCLYLWGYHPDPQNVGMYLFDGSNSWSENWGDHGHFHIPQGYLNNPNLTSDMWSISLT